MPSLLLLSALLTTPASAGGPLADGIQADRPTASEVSLVHHAAAASHDAHVPEPMRFDLVRGLHARAGELETNVLVQGALSGRSYDGIAWAPEIEWAFADGAAIEFEVPMHDTTLEALKVAAQARLAVTGPVTHGVQVIAEVGVARPATDLWGLHVAAIQLPARFSVLWIGGARATRYRGDTDLGLAANATIFRRMGRAGVLGVETNVKGIDGGVATTVLPQWHLPVGEVVMVQAGVGVDVVGGQTAPRGGLRVILQRRTSGRTVQAGLSNGPTTSPSAPPG